MIKPEPNNLAELRRRIEDLNTKKKQTLSRPASKTKKQKHEKLENMKN